MTGFDVKKAAKRFGQQAKKERVYVMRDESGMLTITDGIIVVIGNESETWDIVKALPSPVPSGVGCFAYMNNHAAQETSSIMPAISGAIAQATHDVEDTNLVTFDKGEPIRLLARCDGTGEYTAISEEFNEIFAKANVVYRRGHNHRTPIAVFDARTNEPVGAIMPLSKLPASCKRYLRQLAQEDTESAAD